MRLSPVSELAIVTVAPGTTALDVSRTWPTMALVVSPCASAFTGTRHATVNKRKAKCTARAMNTPLICPKAPMWPQRDLLTSNYSLKLTTVNTKKQEPKGETRKPRLPPSHGRPRNYLHVTTSIIAPSQGDHR